VNFTHIVHTLSLLVFDKIDLLASIKNFIPLDGSGHDIKKNVMQHGKL